MEKKLTLDMEKNQDIINDTNTVFGDPSWENKPQEGVTVTSMIDDIFTFNEEIIKVQDSPVHLLTDEQYIFLKTALSEEIHEMSVAQTTRDLVGVVDALLDNIYFAIGAFKRMGLSREQVQECFDVVHKCNMTKKKGTNAARNHHEDDAIKPEDWQPPEPQIKKILGI